MWLETDIRTLDFSISGANCFLFREMGRITVLSAFSFRWFSVIGFKISEFVLFHSLNTICNNLFQVTGKEDECNNLTAETTS